MKIKIILLFAAFWAGPVAFCQMGINNENSLPDSSAMLDVKSTELGFLLPRMTFEQMSNILNPEEGLMVFCTDCYWNETGMVSIFQNGKWQSYNLECPIPGTPAVGVHVPSLNQIVWKWNRVPIATGYKWSDNYDINSAIDLGNDTSKTEYGLHCNSSYARYVWPYNDCRTENYIHPAVLFCSTNSIPFPTAPAEGVHLPGSGSVVWNWHPVIGATGYRWNTANDFYSSVNMGNGTNYLETNLNCDTPYARYVWAYDSCGNSTPTILTQRTIKDPASPDTTGNYSSTSVIHWYWVSVPGATGYKWNTSPNYATAIDVNMSTYHIEYGLICNTGYTRYVWAYNQCGISSPTTLFQTTKNLAPYSPPYSGTHVPSENQIIWYWTAVGDATGYKWNTTPDYNSAIDAGSSTLMVESGLTCSNNYKRYVWAYNPCGHTDSCLLTKTTLSCYNCGTFSVNHLEGAVAPVSKQVTYHTTANIPGEPSKCWITNNLGAGVQALNVADTTEAAAGWYWQFNQKQGYKHNGISRTPNSAWINPIVENSDWLMANDPCSIEMGGGWRIPTKNEWYNVLIDGGWTNWSAPWNSELKLHLSGNLWLSNGMLGSRGYTGDFWSGTQWDYGSYVLSFGIYGNPGLNGASKAFGFALRCIKDTCVTLGPASVSVVVSLNPVCAGDSVSFTANSVSGGANPFYQWEINGLDTGTNSPSFSYIPLDGDSVRCKMNLSSSCQLSPVFSNTIVMVVIPVPENPTTGNHKTGLSEITWNWQSVPGASGYRWNTTNDYATALNVGMDTSMIETGLVPDSTYTRFLWAYNGCGMSTAVSMSQLLPFAIGQDYGGGRIFYVDGSGEHGLIASLIDQGNGASWGCQGTLIGGTNSSVGAGNGNTISIVNGCPTAGIAARMCNNLVLNGHDDWFLPSKDELDLLYDQSNIVEGFSPANYWSSTESSGNNAWAQSFYNGGQSSGYKNWVARVRAIRVF